LLDNTAGIGDSVPMTGKGYPGGKNGSGVYQTIINGMPPHDVYIEPFLGGGAIMRMKRPAALNIGLDQDAAAVARFGGNRSRSSTSSGSGGASSSAPKKSGADVFRFFQGDAFEFLRGYSFLGRELVYCDPPYMRETRSGRKLYQRELTDSDHAELLRIIRGLPCAVMISGYFTRLYDVELRDWWSVHFPVMTRGATERTEWLWSNFPPPVALHDYRYLGAGYRERERIKRKKRRWVLKLAHMPLLERRALLAAIGEVDPAAIARNAVFGGGAPADPVAGNGVAAASYRSR
jgi:DNA adenine methylase